MGFGCSSKRVLSNTSLLNWSHAGTLQLLCGPRTLHLNPHLELQPVRVLTELGNAEEIQLAAEQVAHIRLMNMQEFD